MSQSPQKMKNIASKFLANGSQRSEEDTPKITYERVQSCTASVGDLLPNFVGQYQIKNRRKNKASLLSFVAIVSQRKICSLTENKLSNNARLSDLR